MPAQRPVVIAQTFQAAMPEILDQNVADGHQPFEDPPSLLTGQFQRDPVLGHVEAVEPPVAVPRFVAGFAVGVGGDSTGWVDGPPVGVVDAERLHLNDFSAQIGHQLGAVWTGPDAGKVEHPVVPQRLFGHSASTSAVCSPKSGARRNSQASAPGSQEIGAPG